jgi:hypothetical protein
MDKAPKPSTSSEPLKIYHIFGVRMFIYTRQKPITDKILEHQI